MCQSIGERSRPPARDRGRTVVRTRSVGFPRTGEPAAGGTRLADHRLCVLGCTAVCEAWRDLRTRRARYPRTMRKLLPATLVLGIVLAARPTPARADFGIGLFLGEP